MMISVIRSVLFPVSRWQDCVLSFISFTQLFFSFPVVLDDCLLSCFRSIKGLLEQETPGLIDLLLYTWFHIQQGVTCPLSFPLMVLLNW